MISVLLVMVCLLALALIVSLRIILCEEVVNLKIKNTDVSISKATENLKIVNLPE